MPYFEYFLTGSKYHLKMKKALFFLSFLISFQSLIKAQSDTLVVLSTTSILFDSDSHELRADQIPVCDSLIGEIGKKRISKIELLAHTDQQGSHAYNLKLSKNRAIRIYKYLIAGGVDSTLVESSYWGEKKLLSNNTSEDDLQMNRRVEVALFIRIPRLRIQGQVIDDSTLLGVSAKVTMRSRFYKDSVRTNDKGEFNILAPKNQNIGLDVHAEGYFYGSKMMKVDELAATDPITIKIPKLKPGKIYELSNMYFEGNQDFFLRRSIIPLHNLRDFMLSNPEICISINGHINLPFSSRRNLNSRLESQLTNLNTRHHDLSIARARRVYHFLIGNGIDEDRMVYKGFGNWEMVFPRASSEKEMAQNRRVEIRIIDCESSATQKNHRIIEGSFFFEMRPQTFR